MTLRLPDKSCQRSTSAAVDVFTRTARPPAIGLWEGVLVLIVLMMILRPAARDGVIPAAPSVSVPRQESVRHDADHDQGEDGGRDLLCMRSSRR
jgi:hypothetical protein